MDRQKKVGALLLLAALVVATTSRAQSDDFGLWVSAGAEKKIDKKWSVGLEGEFRMRDNVSTVDRWSVGVDGEYKVAKWLKASAGYTLLYDNVEKTTYNADGSANNYYPSYWRWRHRFNVSLTGKAKIGNVGISLRERWQYTYRPELTTERWDYDNSKWEDKTISGKGKNVLRSKIKVEYDIPKVKVTPYADVELFNAWSLEKTRYTVGADCKLKKMHTVGLFYRYQDVNGDDDDNDGNSHILGVEYKYKF